MNTNAPPRKMRARSFESVEIYTSTKPPRAYVEVGLVDVRSIGKDALSDAVHALRTKAASIGCDGIVIAGMATGKYNATSYTGACFLYAEDTTWAPPTGDKPGERSCESQRAELRAAPNEVKPNLVRRMSPDCVSATTSPGS